jgi:hypothetical protein
MGPSVLCGLGGEAVNSVLDPSLPTLDHALKGESVVYALNGSRDGRLDTLDTTLHGRGEAVDAVVPAAGPLGRLLLKMTIRAGHYEVDGSQDAQTGSANEEHLGGLGLGKLGNAVDHGDGYMKNKW